MSQDLGQKAEATLAIKIATLETSQGLGQMINNDYEDFNSKNRQEESRTSSSKAIGVADGTHPDGHQGRGHRQTA